MGQKLVATLHLGVNPRKLNIVKCNFSKEIMLLSHKSPTTTVTAVGHFLRKYPRGTPRMGHPPSHQRHIVGSCGELLIIVLLKLAQKIFIIS